MQPQIAANRVNLAATVNGVDNGIPADAKEFNGRPARGMGATVIITLKKNGVAIDAHLHIFAVGDAKLGALPAGQREIAADIFNHNARKRAGFE
jgi:hypothetical protein